MRRVLFPIREIAAAARERGALFHTDAVQATGKIPFSVRECADFASIGAHKMHGPKGIGALYIRRGIPFVPYAAGGDQEHGRRAGTENVAAIAGSGRAAELSLRHAGSAPAQMRALRDEFERRVLEALPGTIVVGAECARLPNTSNLLLRGVESEALIARLDMAGICCSSGSACAAGAHEPSHVLRAMGLPAGQGWGPLRLSFGRNGSRSSMEYLVESLIHNVNVLQRRA
jgi:cysteine desulfurase